METLLRMLVLEDSPVQKEVEPVKGKKHGQA